MAKKVVLVDDIDGSDGDGVSSVEFGWDGNDYRIDLSPQNRKKLADFLALYVGHAERVGVAAGDRRSRVAEINGAGTDPDLLAAMRQWARDNGMPVSDRGRVSARVRDAYEAAQR